MDVLLDTFVILSMASRLSPPSVWSIVGEMQRALWWRFV